MRQQLQCTTCRYVHSTCSAMYGTWGIIAKQRWQTSLIMKCEQSRDCGAPSENLLPQLEPIGQHLFRLLGTCTPRRKQQLSSWETSKLFDSSSFVCTSGAPWPWHGVAWLVKGAASLLLSRADSAGASSLRCRRSCSRE